MKMKLIDVADYCRSTGTNIDRLRAAIKEFLQRKVKTPGLFHGELAPNFKIVSDYFHVNLSGTNLIFNDIHVHYSENNEIEYIEADVRIPQHMPIDFLGSVKISPRLLTVANELLLVTFDGYPKNDLTIIPQLPVNNPYQPIDDKVSDVQAYANFTTALQELSWVIQRLRRACLSGQKNFTTIFYRYVHAVSESKSTTWQDLTIGLPMGMSNRTAFMLGDAEYHYYDNQSSHPDCNDSGLAIFITSKDSPGFFLPNPLQLPKLTTDVLALTEEIAKYMENPTQAEVRAAILQRRKDNLSATINRLTELSSPDVGLTIAENEVVQNTIRLLQSKLP